MYSAFVKLLNMSAAASIPITAVVALRFLLRKTPKKYICLLWAIAALRLMIPFSISSAVSAYNYIGSQQQTGSQMEYIQYNGRTENPMAEIPVFAGNPAADTVAEQKTGTDIYLPTVMGIWIAGFTGMLGYAAMSYLRLRKQTQEAVRFSGNIYRCDHLPSPFILGIFKPIIYLPSDLKEPQRQSVIAHEQAHIRRLDHWWKPMGYLILSVHWFNPLVWVGYALLSRDIETACDERVIEKMSTKQKQEYSETLLQCSMPQKFISVCPLAFGETGVKQRIKGILNYRRPTAWLMVVSLLICMCAGAAFLTDPVQAETAAENYAIQYKLQIGAENISYISVDYPGGRGRVAHADGSAFEAGEDVWLEVLNDVKDLSGVALQAYTDGGDLVWWLAVPENTKNIYSLYDEAWNLQKHTTQPRTGDECILFFNPTTIRHEAISFTVPEQCRYYCHENNLGGGIFLVDNKTVGGVDNYPLDYEKLASGMDWVAELNFPEWKLDNVGYMVDGPIGGAYTVMIFGEAADQEVRNIHHLFYQNGRIYDLWFDQLNAPQEIQDAILTSLNLASLTQPGGIDYSANTEVNLYSVPDENSYSVGTLHPRENFNVVRVEYVQNTLWGFGTSKEQNIQGWVKMEEQPTDVSDKDSDAALDVYVKTGVVTTEGDTALNVRGGPGFSYPSVSYLNAGEKVYIVDIKTVDHVEWGMIDVDQWVCMEYITMNDADDLLEASAAEEVVLRSSPSVQAREIGVLTPDSHIFIEESENIANEKWSYVRAGNMMGWVQAKYLTVFESDRDETDEIYVEATLYPFIEETVVTEEEINLYSSPSVQGRIIGTVHSGDEIVIQKTENVANREWYYVSCGNMTGWMEAEHHTDAHASNHD